MELLPRDFDNLNECPWERNGIENIQFLYIDSMGCEIVRCNNCGIVYAKQRLNKSGLRKYWKDYYSRVHTNNDILTDQRRKMYVIDYDYIRKYVPRGCVLDIGCGDGSFMEFFEQNGYDACGVEFGEEAAEVAKKKHEVYYGNFLEMKINNFFDLIIFRGVLQYIPDAQEYLRKAISILNTKGIIFITAQPNMDSFCFNLFKDKFTLAVNGADFYGYTELLLSKFMMNHSMRKIGEKYFYEETPYANISENVQTVMKAILCKEKGKEISFNSPPFWGNVMSIVYEKL